MFTGRFEYGIDDKSRISVPAKFREILSSNYDLRLFLANLDGCIAAYPYQEWLGIQEKLSKREAIRKEARAFIRYYYSSATECPLDKLGRILVPQTLKNSAHIKKNVVIVGMDKKIEIWAREKWEELERQATADPDLIADIVSELGL